MSDKNRPATGIDSSGKLFDTIVQTKGLKNDAALCRLLNMEPPAISKIRNGRLPVTDATILRVHESIGMPVKEIRQLIGAWA